MMRELAAERSPSSWLGGLWGGVICSTPNVHISPNNIEFLSHLLREYCPWQGENISDENQRGPRRGPARCVMIPGLAAG